MADRGLGWRTEAPPRMRPRSRCRQEGSPTCRPSPEARAPRGAAQTARSSFGSTTTRARPRRQARSLHRRRPRSGSRARRSPAPPVRSVAGRGARHTQKRNSGAATPSLRPASTFMISRRRSGTRRSRRIATAGAKSTGTTMIASTAEQPGFSRGKQREADEPRDYQAAAGRSRAGASAPAARGEECCQVPRSRLRTAESPASARPPVRRSSCRDRSG
jgi:hypothetical protein